VLAVSTVCDAPRKVCAIRSAIFAVIPSVVP